MQASYKLEDELFLPKYQYRDACYRTYHYKNENPKQRAMSNLLPVKVASSSVGSGCANTSPRVNDDSANIHTLKTAVLSRDT